ncbi:MAG: molybdopterin-synthase adenylyltransferase MoeB [Rhodospirillales bacterium]|nr:molybdopterin-synthase adenylyltransferase MoeB [Rhodospirillales bacterium]
MEFTDQQVHRYARHILLDEIGGAGQARLLGARVLVIGAGGLGSPLLLYLAAAGVGTIGIIDNDVVDLSNLQRQIAHTTDRIGLAKVESARQAIAAINPDVAVVAYQQRLTVGNALELICQYDVVADGSDNFPTRFLVNDACYFAAKPLVSAAILRFDGQLATFRPFASAGRDVAPGPCYRCLYREPPPAGHVPTCAEAGVLGAFCGALGSLQATEVIKEILGIGESLAGWLLVVDALSSTWRRIRVRRDPGCPLCGLAPSIADLSVHEGAAAVERVCTAPSHAG